MKRKGVCLIACKDSGCDSNTLGERGRPTSALLLTFLTSKSSLSLTRRSDLDLNSPGLE